MTTSQSPLANATIEAIWISAAQKLGFEVERVDSVYASFDGRRTIEIGSDETLDPDDSAAQLIFHELCHGLCEGPTKWAQPDWGLCNITSRDVIREHACLRIQIYLCQSHGLREAMAPTTDYRSYHDAINDDPLVDSEDPAAELALQAVNCREAQNWIEVMSAALAATAKQRNNLAS